MYEEQPEYTNTYENLADYYEEMDNHNAESEHDQDTVQADNTTNETVSSYSVSTPVCNSVTFSPETKQDSNHNVITQASER